MAVTGGFTNCHCGPDTAACQDPTQPVATVGLCLPSGAPIAVTLVRDCAGTTTQEGWLDLTTGAWSAGAPPEGTVACGGQQSVGTSGVLCDVLPDGQVSGLVLVEYQYAADGSVDSVRLVDAATGEPYTLAGELRYCPAGVEQPERDLLQLCDTADGTVTEFVRDYARDENGQIAGFTDYTLDGQPYTPAGTVTACSGEPEADLVDCAEGRALLVKSCDAEESPGELEALHASSTLLLCDVSGDESGAVAAVQFARTYTYDGAGALVAMTDTTLDGEPYTVAGTAMSCASEQALAVLHECRCDDTDGDGIADTSYVELIAVHDGGTLTPLGTYTEDLSAPYLPVSPVACETGSGPDPARGAQARRIELADGATWDAAAVPLLQAVSATAHDGTGTVTTEDGPTTLRDGETASWSLSREGDAALIGPLTIAAGTGTVTVSYTAGVAM